MMHLLWLLVETQTNSLTDSSPCFCQNCLTAKVVEQTGPDAEIVRRYDLPRLSGGGDHLAFSEYRRRRLLRKTMMRHLRDPMSAIIGTLLSAIDRKLAGRHWLHRFASCFASSIRSKTLALRAALVTRLFSFLGLQQRHIRIRQCDVRPVQRVAVAET
jgi:hypothetical protein